MGKFQKPKAKKTTEHNKQIRKYIRLGVLAILVMLLAVMPMLAARNQGAADIGASILTATVENKTIETQIIGGGQLSSEASLNVRIPENVKLTQYLVGNGDTVKEGDAIAKVDKVSVMTAITEVQETLDYLAEEIAAASGDTASTSVKALSGGTVKVIYAQEGESVQDVMLDHGALAILSLDDTMAVKIEKDTNLDVGDIVCVTLADGTQVDGRVKTNLEGVLTITIEDDDYSVGAKVTVSTEAGEELGTGELYIFSAWSATAYSGRVCDVLVEENDSVYIGQSMFTLEDTGNSAQFQRLIDQRQEYEELMQELFAMYRTEAITAPCDGIVTGVDKDGAYLLSDSGDGWFVSLLSFFGPEKDGFVAHAVTVTEVTASGTQLRIDPKAMYIENLAEVSGISTDLMAMTENWNYPGEIAVYAQDENGLLHSAESAKAGDILLAIGDEEQVRWFVKLDGTNQTTQVTQAENSNGFFAFLLSDEEVTEEFGCDGTNCNLDVSAEGHAPGCSKVVQTISDTAVSICNGSDGCTLDVAEEGHLPGCNKVVTTVLEESDSICNGAEGCTLNPDAQGHIEGCDYYVSISLFNSEQVTGSCNGNSDCTLDENAAGHTVGCPKYTPTITLSGETSVFVNTQYTATVTLSDSMEGTWSVSPDWLSLSNGTITGTAPTEAGSYTITVSFTPTIGKMTTATLSLTVTEASATPSCTGDENCQLDPNAEGHTENCPKKGDSVPVLEITTTTLGTGVVGQSYTYPVQVSGSTAGTWGAENLPSGLVMNEQTGVISGIPNYEGTFTVKVTYRDTATSTSDSKEYTLKVVTAETTVYTGYVAQVVEITDGWAKVKQTLYSYTIADLSEPPKVSASAADLTVEKEYTSDLIQTSELAVGDTVLIVVNNKGTVRLVSKEAVQESQGTPGQQGGTNAGGTPSVGMGTGGRMTGGMTGGMGQAQTYETYSLDKLTVASVTSQEHMTVSITVDELDITKIYVGQVAIVSVDALGGEQFDAEITGIANSGENEGGNSKFTVELTLGKSGDMLPGMYSSAFITLGTSENVLCVPVAALGKDGADSILYTSYDAETGTLGDPVVVSIGVSDGENVQILEGFTTGETCYYEYFDTYVGSDSPQQQGGGFNLGAMMGRR